MKELTVYQRMTASTADLIKVVNQEIGEKCCQPFAIRAFDALNSLQIKNETDAKKASNTFLDNLQTLINGGITSEDYDKIDFVKRGNVITVSARVQALLRAFRRKGFMVIDTIVAVPVGDDVYFEENYKDDVGLIYLLKDKRVNTDREITAERLASNYFDKFLCRLEIRDLNANRTIFTVTEMSNKEVLFAQNASENGIFLSEWVVVKDKNGNVQYKDSSKTMPKKVKVIYDGQDGRDLKINTESIWYKWAAEMVRKTIMRRAFKNLKETLPEMSKTIMAFDTDYVEPTVPDEPIEERIIEVDGVVPVQTINVDLYNLTEEQQKDVEDVFEIYSKNPKNAQLDAETIKKVYEEGKPISEIINEYYAEISNIAKSKKLYPLIENIIKGVPYEKN